MWLFIGLGNPGPQYVSQRHNIGFMVADALQEDYDLPEFRSKNDALYTDGMIHGERVLIVKPLTYMNRSGIAASEFVRFYKVPLEKVIVFHDDLDLSPGKVKVKVGGGAGGHNGLKSLDQHIGKGYQRVRIGIGHPGHRDLVSGYVLQNFRQHELNLMGEAVDVISQQITNLLKDKPEQFLNKVAMRLNQIH